MQNPMPRVECTGKVTLSVFEPDGTVGKIEATEYFPYIVAAGIGHSREERASTVEFGMWETEDLVVRVDGTELPLDEAMECASDGLARILRESLEMHLPR